MHEYDVDRQTVQPCRECRVATKRLDPAEYPQERFLSQILGFGRVSYHAQAQRVNMAAVLTINAFERRGIAFLSFVDGSCLQLKVTSVRRFACGMIHTFRGRGHMVVVMTYHLVPQVERYSRTTSRAV